MRKALFFIKQLFRYFWYCKILRRKRDIVKDRDCKDFEDTAIPVDLKILNIGGEFNEPEYERLMMANGNSLGHPRTCQGDGHYMCAQCKHLDYENSDAFAHLFQKQ
jgi:hypothetical protein